MDVRNGHGGQECPFLAAISILASFPIDWEEAGATEHGLTVPNVCLQEAFKCYVRARDYCTTNKHHWTACLHAIRISIEMGNFNHVNTYVTKAEQQPDLKAALLPIYLPFVTLSLSPTLLVSMPGPRGRHSSLPGSAVHIARRHCSQVRHSPADSVPMLFG